MLYAYLVKIGLQYQKSDNQKNIMKSKILLAWRYKYLMKMQKNRKDSYLIVYLDETWFFSHDTVRMLRSDGAKFCSVLTVERRMLGAVKPF